MQGTPPTRRFASTFVGASGPAFWQTISAAILKALPEALSVLSMPVERQFVKGVAVHLEENRREDESCISSSLPMQLPPVVCLYLNCGSKDLFTE